MIMWLSGRSIWCAVPSSAHVRAALPGTVRRGLLLASILALGAWTRFSGLDLGWFVQDQVRDATIATGIAGGRAFPLVGPWAGGTFRLGPLFFYVLAIPYGLSANPQVASVFLTSLGMISIYLTYHLGKKMFGPPVGLVAAALYAVFPAAVLTGRTVWNPGFVPVATTLFVALLWRLLALSRPWMLMPVLVVLGALLQIHASTIIFVLLLPVALVLYRPQLSWRVLLVGVLCLVLLYAPLVVFEARNGFSDLLGLLVWARKASSTSETPSSWLAAWRGLSIPFLLPERLAAALPDGTIPAVFPAIQRVELILMGLGLLALGARSVTSEDRRPYLLLGLWLALPLIIFPHLKVSIPWYYFDVLYPAQFLVIGLLAQHWPCVWPSAGARWRALHWGSFAICLLVAVVVAVQVWFTMSFDRGVRRSGVLRLTQDVLLNPPPGWTATLETMPFRFKMALAKLFLSKFGVDQTVLERTAHGAVYQQFREDKGVSFLVLSPHHAPRSIDPSLHYLLLRANAGVTAREAREAQSGPYRILAYHPLVRYDSWKWSVNPGPGWWQEAFDDSSWRPVTLPVRQFPDRSAYGDIPATRWPGRTVTFRGWTEGPSSKRGLSLIVNVRDNIRDFGPAHTVKALYLDGQPLEPVRAIRYDTFTAHNIEFAAHVTAVLRPSSNLVAFQITGPNESFDLDVYELRPARGTDHQ
jgi:4-amino-4-deoxy-L-arabinose transferase-like glycosyltransferase